MDENEYLLFAIERKCNSKCNICWLEGTDGPLIDLQTVSLTFFKKFVKLMPEDKWTGVIFSGGEVTLNRQLPEFASCARDKGFRNIMIQTNARALSDLRMTKELKSAGVNEFFVSFHGADNDLSDKITGKAGAHVQTVKGLENLRDLDLTVITNTVMNAMNYEALPDIGEFLQKFKNITEMQFWGYMPMSLKMSELVLPYAKAAPYLNKTLKFLDDHKREMRVKYFPVCLLDGPYKKYHNNDQPNFLGVYKNFKKRYRECDFQKHSCCEGTDCYGVLEMSKDSMPQNWMPSVAYGK